MTVPGFPNRPEPVPGNREPHPDRVHGSSVPGYPVGVPEPGTGNRRGVERGERKASARENQKREPEPRNRKRPATRRRDLDSETVRGANSANLAGEKQNRSQRRRTGSRSPSERAVRREQSWPSARHQGQPGRVEGSDSSGARSGRRDTEPSVGAQPINRARDRPRSEYPARVREVPLRSFVRQGKGISRRLPSVPSDRRSERDDERRHLAGPRCPEPSREAEA